ncbi:MAG: multidrug efflux system outer membrane protein [Janthinobacterium sp.]|jgi:multidrug efflux system outer membrane protein
MKMIRLGLVLACGATLTACALQTQKLSPPTPLAAIAPPEWQAPLPHNGKLLDLTNWWQHQGDALLAQWITAAQVQSPTIAQAGARIAQSRAERVASGAQLLPTLDAAASISRMSQQSLQPMGTTTQIGVQSAWEIDVFGARRASLDAAKARLDGAQSSWHEARVSVAAEVANQYYSLRACRQLLIVAQQDAQSRADTARLTELSAQAGFQAPAAAALARASAAEASNRATQQRALCDLDLKAMVALTGLAEPQLRTELDQSRTGNSVDNAAVQAPAFALAALPAQTLRQRPDVYSAERDVAAASYDVGGAQAQRYPRLSLSGLVGLGSFRSGGEQLQATAWTIGPLQLSVPLFDAGRRRANVDAAIARYELAVVNYRARVRQAVREVETALVNLDSSAARSVDAQTALDGYRVFFSATDGRYRNGLSSLLELEDARRKRLAAENAVVTLQRERNLAWIALYRAAGGGWTAP